MSGPARGRVSGQGAGQGATQAGFSLLEMLVALALFSLMLVLFGGLLFKLERTDRVLSALEAAGTVMLVREFVGQSLESSRPFVVTTAGGRRSVRFTGEAHRISFAGVAAGDRETGGLYQTSLWLDDAGELMFLRQPLDWGDGLSPRPQVLLRNVASLEIAYHPCPTRRPAAALHRWTARDHLPYRITLAVTFRPGDSRTWPEQSVFPAAAACRIAN